MLPHARAWYNRVKSPPSGLAPLGFGAEYWDSNPEHYEGWQQLRDRFKRLTMMRGRRQLAYELASTLLDDVVVAAGGVERAIAALRANAERLGSFARERRLRSRVVFLLRLRSMRPSTLGMPSPISYGGGAHLSSA